MSRLVSKIIDFRSTIKDNSATVVYCFAITFGFTPTVKNPKLYYSRDEREWSEHHGYSETEFRFLICNQGILMSKEDLISLELC